MSRASAPTSLSSAQFPIHAPAIVSQLDFANNFTLVGAMFGFVSIICAIEHQFFYAAISLTCAGVVDIFDGVIARHCQRTELQVEIGKHLDTLADACSFGFSPIVFAYCFGLQSPTEMPY